MTERTLKIFPDDMDEIEDIDSSKILASDADGKPGFVKGEKVAKKTDVESEATARNEADTTLTAKISAEETARTSADTALQESITAEATARSDADEAVKTSLESRTLYEVKKYGEEISLSLSWAGMVPFVYLNKIYLQASSGQTTFAFQVEKGKKYTIENARGMKDNVYNYALLFSTSLLDEEGTGNVAFTSYDNLGITDSGQVNVHDVDFTATEDGYIYIHYMTATGTSLSAYTNVYVVPKLREVEAEMGNYISPLAPLVKSKGRTYTPSISNAGGTTLTIAESSFSADCKSSFLVTTSSWAKTKVDGFVHNDGERVGVFVYVDPSHNEKYQQAVTGVRIQALIVDFFDGTTRVDRKSFDQNTILNGWMFVQSKHLESVTKIEIQSSTNASGDYSYNIGSVICGRETEPVLCFSFDGIYQKSYDCGAYALHRTLGIPVTLFAGNQYGESADYAEYCKKLVADGLAEWGLYSSSVVSASSYSEALNAVDSFMLPMKMKTDTTEVVSVGCAHGANCVVGENALVEKGFKIFRSVSLPQAYLANTLGLRNIDSAPISAVSSGWGESDDSANLEIAKTYIDSLVDNGDWGSIMSHQIVNRADITSDDYGLAYTYELWSAILNYAKSYVTQGKLKVITIGSLWKFGHQK